MPAHRIAIRSVGLLTVRCAVCQDATVNAYDAATLHAVLKIFGWAWLNGNAICAKCLDSNDPKVSRMIRHLQGDYRTEEQKDHATI